MKLSKPKIYDEDGNEIVPLERANGFVVGEYGKFAWTTSEDCKTTFIYRPDPYTGPIAENVEEGWKFSSVPRIFNNDWLYVPYPSKRTCVSGKLFFKYRQKFRNKKRYSRS